MGLRVTRCHWPVSPEGLMGPAWHTPQMNSIFLRASTNLWKNLYLFLSSTKKSILNNLDWRLQKKDCITIVYKIWLKEKGKVILVKSVFLCDKGIRRCIYPRTDSLGSESISWFCFLLLFSIFSERYWITNCYDMKTRKSSNVRRHWCGTL